MATGHPNPGALARIALSLPKLPNPDDISDFVTEMRGTTDILSRLLKETKWGEGLSSNQVELLNRVLKQYCDLSEATVDLFKTLANRSHSVSALFNAILDSESYSYIDRFATVLRSDVEKMYPEILAVERQYKSFTRQYQDLLSIAPQNNRQASENEEKDHNVFQRLDAFWKVVAGQLSSRDLPSPPVSRDARQKWLDYKQCLVEAKDVLMLSSDALGIGDDKQKSKESETPPRPKKGFAAFWSKLTGRGKS